MARSLSAFCANAAGASAAISVYTAGSRPILRGTGLTFIRVGISQIQPVTKAQSDAINNSLLRSSASRHRTDAVDL